MTYTIQRQNHLGFIDEHDCLILSHVQAYRMGLHDLKAGDIIDIEKLMPAKMKQGEENETHRKICPVRKCGLS